jgi:hypothetical protein
MDFELQASVFSPKMAVVKKDYSYSCNRPSKPIDLETSRISHFLDNRLTYGCEVASLTLRSRSAPQKHFLVLIFVRG